MFSCQDHSPWMKDGLQRTDGQKVVDPWKQVVQMRQDHPRAGPAESGVGHGRGCGKVE